LRQSFEDQGSGRLESYTFVEPGQHGLIVRVARVLPIDRAGKATRRGG
jgi:hypothetical protein